MPRWPNVEYSLVTMLTVAGVAGSRWVDVHVVIPETYPKGLYPTNALRSLAEQLVLSEWVFVLDADLVPNANAHVFDQVLRDALGDYVPKWREQETQVRPRNEAPSNPTAGERSLQLS